VERWGLDAHPVYLFTAFSPSEPDCNLLCVEVSLRPARAKHVNATQRNATVPSFFLSRVSSIDPLISA
jgi:hypothetical protein